MAHRILGIDLGTRMVKCAVVERSLRTAALVDFQQEAVHAPYDAVSRKAAMERLLSRVSKGDDLVEAGLPASACMHRTLQFPFNDEKSLREAAGFELESHIPVPLEDVVVDFVVAGEGRDGEYDVLTVAAPTSEVAEALETYKAAGVEPRTLSLVPLACASMLAQLPQCAEGKTLLLDIGAQGTEVLLAEGGNALALRSLSMGSDDVRSRFTEQFDVDSAETDLLVSHSVLLPPEVAPRTSDERLLNEATQSAVMPWLREVRQTLAFVARGGRGRPDRIMLTGGMSRMRGLVEYVERALNLPVSTLDLSTLPINQLSGDVADVGDFGAAAVALALQGTDARGDQRMDFRQGEFAFEGDYQFVRERLPAIAAFMVVALCLLGVRTTIDYRALVLEKERQVSQLKKLSKELTGKRITSFSKLQAELQRPVKVDLASYYPQITAVRTFKDISGIIAKVTEPPDFRPGGPARARLPGGARIAQVAPPTMRGVPPLGGVPVRAQMPRRPGERSGNDGSKDTAADLAAAKAGEKPAGFFGHKVELLSVDVERSKVNMRGDCDSQDALLALQQAIGKHRCFHKIKSSSDKITFQRHKGWFRFNLGFEVRCPQKEDGDEDGKPTSKSKKKKKKKKA